VQQYIPSDYDWRVIVLSGKVLAIVKYVFAQNTWRIMDRAEDGELSKVVGVRIQEANDGLISVALAASNAIGKGLYGVDIKEVDGTYYVIEVNDNPNIDSGNEDQASPDIYKNIVRYLAGEEFE